MFLLVQASLKIFYFVAQKDNKKAYDAWVNLCELVRNIITGWKHNMNWLET